ncbi:hypothetical protein AVEN_13618-1 [Araneus ventricosus]|uniref:Uncharacterized protein n=1 Tax=Araneus ventricosus TaxID=182803 RepID=A0A4Y2FNI8_ARAVE|nr:hypothetical protein AVEN_13618-1 [Araneus ventricosus]
MGLEVENDIAELQEDHRQKLTTEELLELHCASQQEVVEESLSEEEEAAFLGDFLRTVAHKCVSFRVKPEKAPSAMSTTAISCLQRYTSTYQFLNKSD